jgi:hypothetical protein
MWYLIHQQARDIIAEREREADRMRLERLIATGASVPIDESAGEVLRRTVARATLRIANAAYRLASAIDGEAVSA